MSFFYSKTAMLQNCSTQQWKWNWNFPTWFLNCYWFFFSINEIFGNRNENTAYNTYKEVFLKFIFTVYKWLLSAHFWTTYKHLCQSWLCWRSASLAHKAKCYRRVDFSILYNHFHDSYWTLKYEIWKQKIPFVFFNYRSFFIFLKSWELYIHHLIPKQNFKLKVTVRRC